MTPFQAFDDAINRSQLLLDLHDLLINTKKPVKASVEDRYRRVAGWEKLDAILRIGNKNAILLVRNHATLTTSQFTVDSLAALSRAGLVGGVSALDRFMHDLIVSKVLKVLANGPAGVPRPLAEFSVSLDDAEAAISHALRKSKKDLRPRTTLKERFRVALHDQTFQSPRDVEKGLTMLGVKTCWKVIGAELTEKPEDVKDRLSKIVRRRNQIVHEGDMVRAARPRRIRHHPIANASVRLDLQWLVRLGKAIEKVVDAAV